MSHDILPWAVGVILAGAVLAAVARLFSEHDRRVNEARRQVSLGRIRDERLIDVAHGRRP